MRTPEEIEIKIKKLFSINKNINFTVTISSNRIIVAGEDYLPDFTEEMASDLAEFLNCENIMYVTNNPNTAAKIALGICPYLTIIYK